MDLCRTFDYISLTNALVSSDDSSKQDAELYLLLTFTLLKDMLPDQNINLLNMDFLSLLFLPATPKELASRLYFHIIMKVK